MKKNENRSYVFLGFCIFTICFALFSLIFYSMDPDYLWHIKAGEYMFQHGIVKHDVFSWYLNSTYWMSHEWLFELFIYYLKLVFGNFHIFLYCFGCLLLLLFILFLGNKKEYLKNVPFTLFWYLLFLLMVPCYVQVRPHMLSFSLLAISIYLLLDLFQNEDSKKIYFLPLVTILWSNVHGGSSNLPYLLCLLLMIGGAFSFKKGKVEAKRLSKKQFKKYFIVMILCMIAVCINIHGFKMFLYPYENMLDTTMLSNISEWRNTSLSDPYHYLYFFLLLSIVFVFLFSDKKIEFVDFLLFGFVTYLGLKSIRFWIYTYIVMSFVIFKYVKKRKYDKGTFSSVMLVSVLLASCLLLNYKKVFKINYQRFLNKDVIEVIKKEKPKRLFNMYDYGGELIYHDILVFVDGRADLYSKYNYKDYLNISKSNEDYVKLIRKYNFDYFLVDKDYPIHTYLKYNDEYEVIYRNKQIRLYKKKSS